MNAIGELQMNVRFLQISYNPIDDVGRGRRNGRLFGGNDFCLSNVVIVGKAESQFTKWKETFLLTLNCIPSFALFRSCQQQVWLESVCPGTYIRALVKLCHITEGTFCFDNENEL
jgi:hypothetical protein